MVSAPIAAPGMDPLVGAYRVVKTMGRPGMATPLRHEAVPLGVVHHHSMAGMAGLAGLARVCERFRSPVHRPWIAVKLVASELLAACLHHASTFPLVPPVRAVPEGCVATLFSEVARIHSPSIVHRAHRDLKPDNLVCTVARLANPPRVLDESVAGTRLNQRLNRCADVAMSRSTYEISSSACDQKSRRCARVRSKFTRLADPSCRSYRCPVKGANQARRPRWPMAAGGTRNMIPPFVQHTSSPLMTPSRSTPSLMGALNCRPVVRKPQSTPASHRLPKLACRVKLPRHSATHTARQGRR